MIGISEGKVVGETEKLRVLLPNEITLPAVAAEERRKHSKKVEVCRDGSQYILRVPRREVVER